MSRQGTDGSGNVVTDALLLIDDPQSLTAAQAVAPGYGASAPLVVCLPIVYPPSGGYGSTENPACLTYGNNLVNGYYVATNSSAGGTAAANAYPGVLTGANQVTFYGVPLAAPVNAGVYRRFRVTNVRVAPGSATISATVTAGGPNAALLNIIGGTSATVGGGVTGFTTSTTNASSDANLAQFFSACLPPTAVGLTQTATNTPYIALLNFTSNFGGAAKPIAAGLSVVPPVFPATYTYGSTGYESGILVGGLGLAALATPANGLNAATGGAADSGTRFKAVFSGLPTGTKSQKVSLYVSLYNVSGFAADASGGTATGDNGKVPATAEPQGGGSNVALLSVGAGSTVGPAAVEYAAFNSAAGVTGIVAGVANLANPGGATPHSTLDPFAVPLTVDSNGNATAVWEVRADSGKTNFHFAVYIGYTTSAVPTTTPTITLSAAPTVPTVAPGTPAAVQIPSFVTSPTVGPLFDITPCQTALLFPFVSTTKATATQHWDTGIAIANTGLDPWNTVVPPATPNAASTCTLSFYGNPAGGTGFTPPVVTSPAIAPGQTWAFDASDPLATGTAPNVGFSGYMFAVCNFLYAHGFAYIEDGAADTSGVGNSMGYLALVVDNTSPLQRGTALTGENLSH